MSAENRSPHNTEADTADARRGGDAITRSFCRYSPSDQRDREKKIKEQKDYSRFLTARQRSQPT
jgi:hypothetical protein